MRQCRLACAVAGVALLAASLATSAEVFENDTRETAYGIRIEFSRSVRITDYGREFSTQEPEGNSNEFVFTGGTVRNGGTFEVEWSPSSAKVRDYQWLSESDLMPPEPVLTILTDLTYGMAPLAVPLEAVLTNGPADTVIPIEWQFGDGSSGSGAVVTHVYGEVGTFISTVSARLPDGTTVEAAVVICVSPLHVDSESGDDTTADGSEDSPFQTITQAAQRAAPGQALLIAPGIYNLVGGEAQKIEIPDSVSLVGRGAEVNVATSIMCLGSSIIQNVHVYGRVDCTLERGSAGDVWILDSSFTGGGMSLQGAGLICNGPSIDVQDCRFDNYTTAVAGWAGVVSLQRCDVGGSFCGVYTGECEILLESCSIHDCYHGLAPSAGRTTVRGSVIRDNGMGLEIHGGSSSLIVIQDSLITQNEVGIHALSSAALLDLGRGQFGGTGGNSFSGNKDYSIWDERPAYSGPIYAIGNTWDSPAARILEGPAHSYDPARCYIENEGNSIIFSD